MNRRFNIIGACLLATFAVLLSSILAMPLLSESPGTPAEINIDAAAGDGGAAQ
ncbi:hypothetical protein [Shinella sp.]|uniref:hypothetical protein n=1 Tax=Shinella sp. TaxID=1870904 RepID=UPI00301BEBCA